MHACRLAVGMHLPYRHDQVADADGRVLAYYRSEVQINSRLRADGLEDGG